MNSCPACKKENPKIAIFCETCNYPFEGTEKEKAIHIGRFVTKKGVTVDSEIQINRSRSILFIIAIINGLAIAMGIVNSVDYSIADHVFNIIITSVFILCAITNKKFLETNYPRGRAIGVFCSFHFDPSGSKSEILYLDPETSSGLTFSKETHEAEPWGILFD